MLKSRGTTPGGDLLRPSRVTAHRVPAGLHIKATLKKKDVSRSPAGWAKKGRLGLFFMIFGKRVSIFSVHSSQ